MSESADARTESRHYDVVVIGTGSGNMVVTHDYAHLDVAIVEKGTFGGTCINVGCIPSKMYVHPADLAADAADGPRLGVDTRMHGADWPAIRERIFKRIDAIVHDGLAAREDTEWIDVYRGVARFTGPGTLEVDADGVVHEITADQVVLAAGSRPVVPPVPGLDEVEFYTSDTIMRLDDLPKRVGVVGGGYIGCEFSHVLSSLGAQVTIIDPMPTLLGTLEADVADRFTELARERWDVRVDTELASVEQVEDGIRLHLTHGDDDSTVEVDLLLVATGRVPNTDVLDVAAAGIETDDSGHVKVDEYLSTSVSGVWALGDVCDTVPLKHVANEEARVVSHNVLHPDAPRASALGVVPQAVFSRPQVASVGQTEAEARKSCSTVVTFTQDYADVAFGWALEDEGHFVKLVADSESGRLLGAHLIGPEASVLIQPLIQAISLGQGVEQVARGQYWIHPALTEVVENALLGIVEQCATRTS